MPHTKPTAWRTSFRKTWEIMSWSTQGPRASFPWGETRKWYFPFIPQWHMPILPFVSLCPSPALPEEQRHHSPAPGTSLTFGLCCILLLHQESPTEQRKNQECRDVGSHLSTAEKDAFPSGFCLHRGKDPSTANKLP